MKTFSTAWLKTGLPILTLFSVSAFSQQRHEFSVLQAVDYAKKNNVQVKMPL